MFKGAKVINTERGETFLEYITTLISSPCLGISILQNSRIYVNSFEKKNRISAGETVNFHYNSKAFNYFNLKLFLQVKMFVCLTYS